MVNRGPLRACTTALAALALASSCGGFGDGDIEVRVSANGVAMAGLPFQGERQDDALALVDDWTIELDRYLVSIGDLRVATSDGETGAASQAFYVVDLHAEEPAIELLEALGAKRWDAVSWSVAPPDSGSVVKTFGATDDDVARLRDGGYAYFIEGRASKGDRAVTFSWGLANPTDNEDCSDGGNDGDGIVVSGSSVATLEITIHVEHMLWDTLGSEQTRLRFDAIAAVADEAGVVSWGALAEQRLDDVRDETGSPLLDEQGQPVVYDPGDVTLPRDDLQQFILAATRTQAHLDGDGRCSITPR